MNPPSTRTTLLNRLPMMLAAYPLVWLALLYMFVARARMHLGHWPAPYRPDPKDLGFLIHHQVIVFGLVALPVVALGTVVLSVVGRRISVYPRIWPALSLLAASVVGVVALGRLDPGGFFEWFGD